MRMAWVSIVALALLPFISQTDAITACKSALINRVYKQVQLATDASAYLTGETVWVPLMITTDASGFTSRQYNFGSLSSNSLSATISTLSTAGVNTSATATYTVTSSTSFTITESDGSYEAYAFKCSDNMMGVFRCKAGTNPRVHWNQLMQCYAGYAQLFTFARTSESTAEIAGEIATCTRRMKLIDSYFNPIQLAHPYE